MSGFKKKGMPEKMTDFNKTMSMILGSGGTHSQSPTLNGCISRSMILACAMFWDSKQRIDKIKSLVLKSQELTEFEDCNDFKISELASIQLLSLSNNRIMHLQPLAPLDTLICLNVNHNRIYDISTLQHLVNLQELYASHNRITNIDALRSLSKLRVINLYSNEINRLEETLNNLQQLPLLDELDIENNPIYPQSTNSQELKLKFICLPKLTRFNGQLILQSEKSQSIHKSTHFDQSMSTSCVIGLSSHFLQTPTNVGGLVYSQILQKYEELEKQYMDLDDQFEQQIMRNVQLKSACVRKVLANKQQQAKQEQIQHKTSELKLLKRKVKGLKQNLFNPTSEKEKGKCDLLRQIFELEMSKENKECGNNQKQRTQMQRLKAKIDQFWARKFDYDEEIIIGCPQIQGRPSASNTTGQLSDDQYLLDDNEQIEQLLRENSSAIEDIRRELRQMSQIQ